MKIGRFDQKTGQFLFRFEPHEFAVFRQLLSEYPALAGAPNRISAGAADDEIAAEQELLAECLDEHRAGVRAQLDEFLEKGDRLMKDSQGWKMGLDASDINWLLQILNDIRIGNWTELGRPDPAKGLHLDTMLKMRNASAMQVCGFWQTILLHALNAPPPAPKPKRAANEKVSAKAKTKTAIKKQVDAKGDIKPPAKATSAKKIPKPKRKGA